MNDGLGLHVWCEDLRVTPKIDKEGVTHPPALDFDDVEGDIPKEIFEGGPDVNTVAV